ncbi:DUF6114 domain-containing protein [Micromonospora sp. WMMD812]|uniref:DUF6114 domain-containing protein n=1 Tax=Micromonospora sp. WMMD812 TaxID=3015152 RepID=UPI00248BC822|nr:DUF6114 domain-containing protein [Micromonospora sp. WMMD812]WBB65933.1 DUF6114 domain-containing protein [Micromonospora sp. WMMD812]
MTTANPSPVRCAGAARTWRAFRRWRRTRPFWGGLVIALAGIEMFASTRMTLNGLSFSSGATGLQALLIPVVLVTCGLLLWLTPAQRLFYSVVAAVTSVYSLIGLNLGGFFLGLLLGMVGSALAFAWTPVARPEPAAPPNHPGDAVPRQRDAAAHPADPEASPEAGAGSGDPHYFALVLVLLGLSAAGLVAVPPRPAQAAPGLPGRSAPVPCPTRSKPVTPPASPGPSGPAATPTASPSPAPERTSGGNIITDILEGLGDLLTGGRRSRPTPTPSATPTAAPSATSSVTATAAPPAGRPGPAACPSATPTPARPGKVEAGKLLPRIAADPGQPKVAQTPSKLTGSSLMMSGLRFEGITDLPTEGGSLKVLKFSMRKAVTDDFLLRADGPQGLNQRYATDRLTVQGDVAFYTTRFVGRLLGLKITLTPDLPFPDGIPITSPIPVTFTDPAIDLAYVTTDTLTARPALALSIG